MNSHRMAESHDAAATQKKQQEYIKKEKTARSAA
jgi:hypothetical protein